jgi:hypothetical protein
VPVAPPAAILTDEVYNDNDAAAAPAWVMVNVWSVAPVAVKVAVAVRVAVVVLACTVNVTVVVPDGPVLRDAVTQLGSPDCTQPSATFVVTVVEAFPPVAATVPDVGDNDRVAAAPRCVRMKPRELVTPVALNQMVAVRADVEVLAVAVNVTVVVPAGPLL